MDKIKKKWDSYEEKVIPALVGPVQRVESRNAFYAGAASMLAVLLENISDSDEPVEKDYDLIREINQELMEYLEHVR